MTQKEHSITGFEAFDSFLYTLSVHESWTFHPQRTHHVTKGSVHSFWEASFVDAELVNPLRWSQTRWSFHGLHLHGCPMSLYEHRLLPPISAFQKLCQRFRSGQAAVQHFWGDLAEPTFENTVHSMEKSRFLKCFHHFHKF